MVIYSILKVLSLGKVKKADLWREIWRGLKDNPGWMNNAANAQVQGLDPMRILYLSQLMPYPPDSGPKVRQYYALRYLAQHHEVTLIAFIRPDDPAGGVEHIRGLCAGSAYRPDSALKSEGCHIPGGELVERGVTFIIRRDTVPGMTSLVKGEIATGKYDIIQADQLWMAQYGLLGAGSRSRLVLDEHNACFQIFQRLAQGEKNPLKRLALEHENGALCSDLRLKPVPVLTRW